VKFLGHTISKDGIFVDPSKVQEVMDWNHPSPYTTSIVFRFGGLLPSFHSRLL
jgi:hypothetical protein